MENKSFFSKNVIKIIAFVIVFVTSVFIVVVSVSAASQHVAKKGDNQEELIKKYEARIEPIVANTEFREIVAKNPARLAEYTHITDVLYGTNFSQGLSEERFAQRLSEDPILMRDTAERYFKYLDEKY